MPPARGRLGSQRGNRRSDDSFLDERPVSPVLAAGRLRYGAAGGQRGGLSGGYAATPTAPVLPLRPGHLSAAGTRSSLFPRSDESVALPRLLGRELLG